MDLIIPVLVVGSSLWVFFDARSIGIQRGQRSGFFNMGPTGWAFSCLLLWILAFPVYLAKRSEYKLINRDAHGPSFPSASSAHWEITSISAQGGKLSFVCPSCNTRYSISEEHVPAHGANVKCKVCGHLFSMTRRKEAPAMKLAALITSLFILLLYSGACAEKDDSFRCGPQTQRSLVSIGSSEQYILDSCGEPEIREYDRWVYNLGQGDFIYTLRFKRGRVFAINRGERGYGTPAVGSFSSSPPPQPEPRQPQQQARASDNPSLLKTVNLVRVTATEQDGVLNIGILYTNRDTDKLVFWEDGTCKCHCLIYENEGTLLNHKQGERIGQVYKALSRHGQDFYFDVPFKYRGYGTWAMIECEVNTGYRKMMSTADVMIE